VILAGLLCLAAGVAVQDAGYLWPLDLPRQLTSSFAEYRPGRFHAGIDLRTGGVGIPVKAIADGYVSRVRCSPYGYGKAIYLTLDDGNTVVYGHLDDYYDELRAYVQAEQHKRRSYTVDLNPEARRFSVKRGQIIAKSGQTGIGAPHLHFELRDAAERPVNPRNYGMTWPDTQRPELRSLFVLPLAPESRVNGDSRPATIALRAQGEGRYAAGSLRIRGPVAFGVDLVDPGTGGYRLGVHTLRLSDGADREVFRIAHDRIAYDNSNNGAVAYYPFPTDSGKPLMLWRWPGNVCEIYAQSTGSGAYLPGNPKETLRVDAVDFSGNTATLSIPIEADTAAAVAPPRGVAGLDSGKGSGELDCTGPLLLITARFSAPESVAPVLEISGASGAEEAALDRVEATLYRAAWAPRRAGLHTLTLIHPRIAAWSREVHVFLRGEGGSADIAGARIVAAPNSAYGTLYLRGWKSDAAPKAPARILSPIWEFWPAALPMDQELTLDFPAPAGDSAKAHIYRRSGASWSRQDTRRDGGRLRIQTRSLGAFCVMEDTTPPVITGVQPAEGAMPASRRPALHATITDNASGIASVELYAGEKWLLCAYDPERQRMEWEQDEDLPTGSQTLTFRVTDAAGNTAIARRSITVK
jgi:hypothetical protein